MDNVHGKNTKRKHLSKNKKKSWRKVNVDEIEDFLEEERLQERTGGLVAEKKDEDLFFVDTAQKSLKNVEKRTLRKRKAQNHLKDIEVTLKPPPPKKKDKRAPAVIEKEASGKLSVTKQQAIKQRLTAVHKSRQKLRERVKVPVAQYDLWGDTLEKEEQAEDEHYLRATRKKRAKVPCHVRQPTSLLPAVEAPHPGASYNPAYDDYQDLLLTAHSKEAKKLEEEERIRRALDEKFPSEAPTEASKLAEMSAGLYPDEDSNDESDRDVGDVEQLSVNPPVRRDNKKDERKRKKEKARKKELEEAKKLKEKRVRDNTFYRLKSIKAEIREKDAELQSRAVKRQGQRLQKHYETKRLSRTKFEEPDFDLKLSDELVGSLREMKPEGNLLLDRFHSMMKRNMLEPRGAPGRKQKRKYKPKVFEKKSHKEIK